MNLDNAVVYDIETFPNAFTIDMEMLNNDTRSLWEISEFRDDRVHLMQWFNWLCQTQSPMIGFFSEMFDYPVIHYIFNNPNATVQQIYERAQSIINDQDKNRFANMIWSRDRFAPQIDLFKIHHFDNPAKRTSLKSLEINMRMENVKDMPLTIGERLSQRQVNDVLIPYNKWDVKATKKFAHFSMNAINFRIGLMDQFGVDVLNFNDSKIGSKILEKRLGDDIIYDRSSGRKVMRQSPRHKIALGEIIFPFIHFNNPEFNRILNYLKQSVLTASDIETGGDYKNQTIVTKGVFANLHANVGGIVFKFGTGGLHASVDRQRIIAGGGYIIRDIDVASLYPNIGIQNGLYPEHLGEMFVMEYAKLPQERKEWQKKKGKKCTEANSIKLASNGTYGNSNNQYSPFYDPKYTMTITVNGQLMLAMLSEWLLTVPTLKIIQVNTDGITYIVHESYEPQAAQLCRQWEQLTKLTLEDADYSRMFIRDVNSYIAEPVTPAGSNEPPAFKMKGAYWFPDPLNYAQSISESQPPAWHKDLGNVISIRAATTAMLYDIPIADFIKMHSDPYDFMLQIKVGKSDTLTLDGQPVQKTSRYYVVKNGGSMVKISPPAKGAKLGSYKRASRVPEQLWNEVNAYLASIGNPDGWDERIHTKNKSKNEMRETGIQAGFKVALCNDVNDFNFDNIDYDWYIREAEKLMI